ncbi:MAG: tRNA lysidine(34) synthetase TilS [Anaerolineae bacterium]
MSVLQTVRATITAHGLLLPNDTTVVGVSGGTDSLCLLHLLHRLAGEYRIRLHVAHLDHGLRGTDSAKDAAFVASLCQAWYIPCTIERADVPSLAAARGLAIEEAARQARYSFMASLARDLGAHTVAVAHHADDQVETVLMHLLRGSGLAGLRGMRPLSWVDELRLNGQDTPAASPGVRIRLIRPLLRAWRTELETYANEHDLQPRFDLSNLDQTYFRNRLRHELIPYLETFNPSVRQVIARTSEVLAAEYEFLREQLERTWPAVVRLESAEAVTLERSKLADLPLALQRSVLREAVHRLRRSLRNISLVHIDDALQVVIHGQVGSSATLPGGLLLTVDYDEVVMASEDYVPIAPELPRLLAGPLPIAAPGETPLPSTDWTLVARLVPRRDLPDGWHANRQPFVAYLDAETLGSSLALRRRVGSDWFMPLGMAGHRQRLGDFLTNAKVPRRVRDMLPLLVSGSDIVWVVGWRIDARFAVRPETEQVLEVRMIRAGRNA